MAKGKGGILSRVVKARDAKEDYLKVLIHGQSGAGKSTMCGTAPGKVLYLWTERQGVISFKRVNPEADSFHIEDLKTLKEFLDALKAGGHGYDSVCLDSLTEMQRLIIDEVTAQTISKTGKDNLSQNDWGIVIKKTASLVRSYRDLPMNVVVTALSDETVVGDSDRYVRPALAGKKLPGQISQYFNVVGYCFKVLSQKLAKYIVLLEGSEQFSCKGLPGLRYREDPDISYWYDRAFKGADPRDEEARMILEPSSMKPSPETSEKPNGEDQFTAVNTKG